MAGFPACPRADRLACNITAIRSNSQTFTSNNCKAEIQSNARAGAARTLIDRMPLAAFKSRGNASRTGTAGQRSVRPFGYKSAVVLSALLAAFILLQSLLPLRTAIQIGGDEGFALAKATLCLKGFKLYTEVWNDQPPLHTFLLTQILKHIGPSILGPRILTVAFAAILLTAVFLMALRVNGLLVAATATDLVIASPGFLELSSSCMVEIPALAPTIVALCLLLASRPNRWPIAEIVSGVLFGVALQTKFNAAIYLPLAGFIVWLRDRKAPSLNTERASLLRREEKFVEGRTMDSAKFVPSFGASSLAQSLALFAASVVLGFFAVGYVVGETAYLLEFKQAWSAHVASAKSFEYGSPEDRPFDWTILLKNWDATIPALVGIVASLRRIRTDFDAIIPSAWLTLTFVVFATHRPWWSYYYIHDAIPLCWCAAIGFATVAQRVNPRRSPALFAVLVGFALCALPWVGSRLYLQVSGIRNSPQTYSSLVLTEVERFKPFTQFMYTDQRVYSFHTGIPIPPKLAVLSLKRLWSGDLTNEKIAGELASIKPGLILLANDSRALPFDDLLRSEYRLVYQDNQLRLYAQKAVIAQAN